MENAIPEQVLAVFNGGHIEVIFLQLPVPRLQSGWHLNTHSLLLESP